MQCVSACLDCVKTFEMGSRRVRCPDCFKSIGASSDLVHARYCRPRRVDDGSTPDAKRVCRTGLFSSGVQAGLGPGAAFRREDEGVMIACDEAVPPPPEAIQSELPTADDGTGSDSESMRDVEEVYEWTSDASSEEVMEAMRRVLLELGTAIGEKQTNHIIRLLRHPSFCVDKFRQGITSLRDIRETANSDLEHSLLSLRFHKKTVVDDEEDATAGMWMRDPVDVVKRQVAQLSFKNAGSVSDDDKDKAGYLYTHCFQEVACNGERQFNHPMSTDEAASVYQRVRTQAMNSCAAGVVGVGGWKDGYDFVMFLQAYSDKSKQTLKASSHAHLPLHVSMLNTSLTSKEKLICAGDCVVGYMPTSVKWEDEQRREWLCELVDGSSGRGSRESRNRILQSSIEACLDPLLRHTVPGFTVVDSNGTPKRCHPVLVSYVTDLPEGWDVSGSMWQRCSRCYVQGTELHSTTPCEHKKAASIVKLYDDLDRAKDDPTVKLTKKSGVLQVFGEKKLITVRPYLLSLGDNYGIDMYKCLRYEVMHNIHLGMTRTLINCLGMRMKSSQLSSAEFIARGTGEARSFSSIRTTVLRALNVSLEMFDRQSPTIDFKVSHRSGSSTQILNGLYTKYGMAAMLEANDYARILQVMPFLAATCDRMCDEPGTTTKLFVQYVELVYEMLRVKENVVAFTAGAIDDLRRSITEFMEAATTLYRDHTAKGMDFPKMHALMHIADDIEQGGSLAHYRADSYEASHKRYKKQFASTSRRGDAGQDEALEKISRADFLRLDSGRDRRGARREVVERLSSVAPRVRGARTKAKVQAVTDDAVVLSRPKPMITADIIQEWLREFCNNDWYHIRWTIPDPLPRESAVWRENLKHRDLFELASDLGRPVDFEWFIQKLDLGADDTIARSTSATVPGYPCPELVKSSENSKMLVTVDRSAEGDGPEGTMRRDMQRLVAAHSFYSSRHRVQMFALIEAGDAETTKAKLHQSERAKYAACNMREVYVAKVLALLTVRRNGEDVPEERAREEVALIQYLDVCQDEPDEIEKALGCVKLKWAQEECDEDVDDDMDSMVCQYDIVDIGTIRGVPHVVRGDYGLGVTETYRCEGDRHWADCWFYMNRFKIERRGARVFMEEKE